MVVVGVVAAAVAVVGIEAYVGTVLDRAAQPTAPLRVVGVDEGGSRVPPAPGPAPCPLPVPSTATGYQALFDGVTDGWVGGDQAASVALPDGRTLWLFGDTMVGSVEQDGGYAPGTRMVSSSFLVQDGGCLDTVATTGGGPVLPDPVTDPGARYWPQTAVVEDGRLLVFAVRIHATGDGLLDFRASGSDLAVYDLPDGQDPVLRSVGTTPSSRADPDQVTWGAAVLTRDGFHHVYGVRHVDAPLAFGPSVHLARVPVGRLTDPVAWTYFDGTGYDPDPASSVPLQGAQADLGTGWSQAFSLHHGRDGRVVAVYKQLDFLGDRVRVAVADDPAGPFTEVDAFSSPSTEDVYTYTALAHPHLALADGGLLVGVSRNSPDLSRVLADARLYRPQFHAVRPDR